MNDKKSEKKSVVFRCTKKLHRDFRKLYIELGYRTGSDLVTDALREFILNHSENAVKELEQV